MTDDLLPHPLRLVLHEQDEAMTVLRPDWQALFAQRDDLTFFSSHVWHLCWWNAVGRYDKTHRLHILEFVDERRDKTVGIFPLMRIVTQSGDFLRSHSYPYADYFDVLASPGYELHCAEAFRRYLLSNGKAFRRVYLSSVRRGSCTFRLLCTPPLSPWTNLTRARPCPILDLRKKHAVERALDKRTTRSKARRLRRLGQVRVIHLTDAASIQMYLDRFVEMHNMQWQRTRGAVGLFYDPSVLRFFDEMSRVMSTQGSVLLSVLFIETTPIAIYYGFVAQNTYYYYRSAFDQRYVRYSPGHVLLEKLVEFCVAQRLTTFDFLRGEYSYKYRYANRHIENVDVTIHVV